MKNIKYVDISSHKDKQVIVDKEQGQYLGHVSTVLLEDNHTILAVYPRGHGRGVITLKRSADGGRTWSDRLPVPQSWKTSLECPTLYRIIDKYGTKRLILFSGTYPIRASISEDNGLSWSELESIGDYGGIVAMSDVIKLKSGNYMALFHDDEKYMNVKQPDIKYQVYESINLTNETESKIDFFSLHYDAEKGKWSTPILDRNSHKANNNTGWEKPILIYETGWNAPKVKEKCFSVYKVESSDGGLTWGKPVKIISSSKVHLCEPGAARSPDANQIAVLLRENSRTKNSMVIFSNDEGKTWTDPVELPASLTGDRHTIKYLSDGRLIVTFRDMGHRSKTKGDWVAWIGTYDDIAHQRQGQYKIRLMKNYQEGMLGDCAYPGLEVLQDDTIVATTYGHWQEGEKPYIVCVRFKLEEVL